ncbi:MAG: dihydroneopterin aldolase [Bradyrhizobium sp.]|uniref:dihydroneopterin aldolase n=1 Tax=Bradyrhizobium sp. TaxID=376 RepID=UPI001210A811|nr:dihydroneopterin aldolase [Bradyrhizobium sp.]THD63402.1 MAG: dihydroneopterin aldolase [Bradyrhizobium sp.]
MNTYYSPAETLGGDRVIIEDLRIPACIGVYPHEKIQKQVITLNIEMGLATQVCFRSDQVQDTIDYAAVADALKRLAVSRHFHLIEGLAEQISNVVIDSFGASWVKVHIRKIGVIPDAKCAAVAITRLNPRFFGRRPLSEFNAVAQDKLAVST